MLETTVTESASFDFDEASEVLNELPPLVQTSVLRRNRTDFPVWGTIPEFCLSLASTCWWRWLKAGKIECPINQLVNVASAHLTLCWFSRLLTLLSHVHCHQSRISPFDRCNHSIGCSFNLYFFSLQKGQVSEHICQEHCRQQVRIYFLKYRYLFGKI